MIEKVYIMYKLELIIHCSQLVNTYFAVSALIFIISYAGIYRYQDKRIPVNDGAHKDLEMKPIL